MPAPDPGVDPAGSPAPAGGFNMVDATDILVDAATGNDGTWVTPSASVYEQEQGRPVSAEEYRNTFTDPRARNEDRGFMDPTLPTPESVAVDGITDMLADPTFAGDRTSEVNPNPPVTRDPAPSNDQTTRTGSSQFESRGIDLDNDGRPDAALFARDRDGDRQADVEIIVTPNSAISTIDIDGDNRPDTQGNNVIAVGDLDADGRPEVIDRDGDLEFEGKITAIDLDGDGKADAVDLDGDGKADGKLEAVDLDGDGKPDLEIVTKLDEPKPPKQESTQKPPPAPKPAPEPEPIVLVREQEVNVTNTIIPDRGAPTPPPPPAPTAPAPDAAMVDFASSLMGFDVGDGDGELADLFRDHGYTANVESDKSIADLNASLDDGKKVFVALDRDELLGVDDDDSDGGDDANDVMELVSIDEERGVVVLRSADGETIEVPLDTFEDAWADADNSLVFGEQGDDSLADRLLQPAVVLVPLAFAGGVAAVRGTQIRRAREQQAETSTLDG
jgi:hypothetical protein